MHNMSILGGYSEEVNYACTFKVLKVVINNMKEIQNQTF